MKSRGQSMLLAAIAVAALAVPLTIQSVGAQDAPQRPPALQGGQVGPPNPQRPGQFPGQPGPMPQMGMMMGGGGATMIDDAQFLYILRGNQLLKVQKSNLQVVAQSELPMPGGRGAPNAPGGGPGLQRRGGGQAPPPPPSD